MTQPIPTIRAFRAEDAHAISEMMRKLAAVHGDVSRLKPGHLIEHALGGRKILSISLAVIDKEPVGFIATHNAFDMANALPICSVEALYVEPKHQRHGIARQLIHAAMEVAATHGYKYFKVMAAPNNKKANTFYARLGLKQRDRTPSRNTYFADHALMKKLLKGAQRK